MQFSQSRVNSRGPLIAVIKIEIDTDRTDRIFLHQNDDDFKLAQQFILKHHLQPSITHHIYQRIAFSRKSVEAKQNVQMVTPKPFNYPSKAEHLSHIKHMTPYQNLASQREQPSSDSLFGQSFKKTTQQTVKNPSSFQTNEGDTYAKLKCIKVNDDLMQAPIKKLFEDKQFKLYQDDQSQLNEQVPIKLFPSQNKPNPKINASPPPKTFHRAYQTNSSERRANQIQEMLEKRESDYLRTTKSLTKFTPNQTKINKVSSPLAACESVPRNSNYDKPIHVKIIKKQQIQSLNQSLKRSMSKQQMSRIGKDVTSRLYNQAQIKKSYLNIIKQKAKKQKQKSQDVELTHRPSINKISQVIAQGRRKDDMSVQKYLIEQGKKIELKKQQQIKKQYLKEIENCTFQPQMNLISQKLAAQKNKFDSRMSESSKCTKNKQQKQNLFQPSLSKVSNQLMKFKGNFQTRQRQYLQQKNYKLVEKVKEKRMKQKIDIATGQQLFKPKIHDLGIRQSQGSNIGNYLYELGKQSNHNYEIQQNRPKINESSEQIVQQLHFKRISWLFVELDSDQDGLISAQKINIKTISEELLNVIKPILFQMEEMNEELNLFDFKNAVEMLHRQLTAYQKNILYHSKAKVK